MGNIIIGGGVAALAALAARSLWKKHKSGQCFCDCGGSCADCHGCSSTDK